jgi:Icc-related predicted phosphoesterase
MQFIAISDTHGKHQNLKLPAADCIIHAGDVSNTGKEYQVQEFMDWFSSLPYQYKIFIAGNHDFWFEQVETKIIKNNIPDNVIYLNDSGINIEGINIWGSPVSPWFYDWAFNRQRGADIKSHWDLIPANTNILITHGPAFGILDATIGGQHVGCDDLLATINIIKPNIHICGHIHEAYGQRQINKTTFINASVLDHRYDIKNNAVKFELE